MRKIEFGLVAAGLILVASVPAAYADVITFDTPLGATAGGLPVDALATFTTGAGFVDVTLTDLEANPTSVAQMLSDLDFVLSNGAATGTLLSSLGQQITIASNGSFTLGPTASTGWPGGGGTYSAANSSIAGNGPHNPFINQTATFHIGVAGVDSSTTITSATFSFGTTAGSNVPGTVPEPSSLLSLAAMLGGIVLVLRKRLGRVFIRQL